jgi:uncharacterized membrane protein YfcA
VRYDSPVQSLEAVTLLAGVIAGFLGALVGIGGGVLLIPLLNGFLGIPFAEARGVSLVGVLGTSGSAVMAPSGRRLVNPRLATFLILFSVSGASLGATFQAVFTDRTYEVIFGVTMAAVAALMLVRLNNRNVLPVDTRDLGVFGSQFRDAESGADVAYRVKRLPLAGGVAFLAGVLASLIGIGGGIVIVPTLNSMCGVPMRVAAATSVLMIGITAIPGTVASWADGSLGDYHLAGMTCLGALIGFQLGMRVGHAAPVKLLKGGMSLLLMLVAIQYLFLRP